MSNMTQNTDAASFVTVHLVVSLYNVLYRIQQDPTNVSLHLEYLIICVAQGSWVEVVAESEEIERLDPTQRAAMCAVRALIEPLERGVDAINETITAALALDPSDRATTTVYGAIQNPETNLSPIAFEDDVWFCDSDYENDEIGWDPFDSWSLGDDINDNDGSEIITFGNEDDEVIPF